jgi:hypothetical protein
MNKRGQFYLIAAIIIVIIISSIASLSNYALTLPAPKAIDSFSSDLEEEGPRIIDYGIYSNQDVNILLENFAANDFAPYFLKKSENSNVVFIYGNKTNLYGVKYNLASRGTILATIGGATTWNSLGIYAENVRLNPGPSERTVSVNLLGKEYIFELTDNRMFYFIIAQQKEGETYVQRNS